METQGGDRQGDERGRGRTAEDERVAHHEADDGAPQARLTVARPDPREQRYPAALDPVAEFGQHGRQDRE